jgi:hypothetical protein
MSRWYRTHVGLVTDAKLGEAALIAETSRAIVIASWHAILESCADVNDAGRFDTTPRRVAAVLGEPVGRVEAVFAAFTALGMIAAGCVVAWSRRQFESDSSTERSRKHREARRNGELERGNVSKTPVQRCATVPYSYSETETEDPSLPLPPPPADDAGKPTEPFAEFWQAMPSPNPSARAAAQVAFERLPPTDQGLAIAGARRYAEAFAVKPTTHPISPTRFLRERCFEGYGPQASADAATVFVPVDSPQWRAWAAYKGKPIPLNRDGTGWHFPTEWPPERDAA